MLLYFTTFSVHLYIKFNEGFDLSHAKMKNYIAYFENNEFMESETFQANNLVEAKKYAQMFKRKSYASDKTNGRTRVRVRLKK